MCPRAWCLEPLAVTVLPLSCRRDTSRPRTAEVEVLRLWWPRSHWECPRPPQPAQEPRLWTFQSHWEGSMGGPPTSPAWPEKVSGSSWTGEASSLFKTRLCSRGSFAVSALGGSGRLRCFCGHYSVCIQFVFSRELSGLRLQEMGGCYCNDIVHCPSPTCL